MSFQLFPYAIQFAKNIVSPQQRSQAYFEIALDLVKSNKYELALDITHFIDLLPLRIISLTEIAVGYLKGHEDKFIGRSILEDAFNLATSVTNQKEREEALRIVAKAWAKVGEYQVAISVSSNIKSQAVRSREILQHCIYDIASEQISAGNVNDALELVEGTFDISAPFWLRHWKDAYLAGAIKLAEMGNKQKACKLFRKVTWKILKEQEKDTFLETHYIHQLVEVALSQNHVGFTEDSLKTLDVAERVALKKSDWKGRERPYALRYIAIGQAKVGNVDAVTNTIDKIGWPDVVADAMSAIAVELASSRDLDKAVDYLFSIPDYDESVYNSSREAYIARALIEIAVFLSEKGDISKATDILELKCWHLN